jgi:hypothetical protein
MDELRTELAGAAQDSPKATASPLQGLTLRLEDLVELLRDRAEPSVLSIQGHIVKPLLERAEAQSDPSEHWLCGGLAGGDIRLRAIDHLHLQVPKACLQNVCIVGDSDGNSCSRLVVHGDDSVLSDVEFKCCEVHLLASGITLRRCSIDGQGMQHTGCLIGGSSPAQQGLPKGIQLLQCSVKATTVGLHAVDVEEASIVDCECVSVSTRCTHMWPTVLFWVIQDIPC